MTLLEPRMTMTPSTDGSALIGCTWGRLDSPSHDSRRRQRGRRASSTCVFAGRHEWPHPPVHPPESLGLDSNIERIAAREAILASITGIFRANCPLLDAEQLLDTSRPLPLSALLLNAGHVVQVLGHVGADVRHAQSQAFLRLDRAHCRLYHNNAVVRNTGSAAPRNGRSSTCSSFARDNSGISTRATAALPV